MKRCALCVLRCALCVRGAASCLTRAAACAPRDAKRVNRGQCVKRAGMCGGAGFAALLLCAMATASVTVAHADPWRRYQSAHVALTAPAGHDVTRLLTALERAYASVRAYGLALPPMVQARTYANTPDFVRGSGGSWFNLAIARGGTIHLQPTNLLIRREALGSTLCHEMVHVALERSAQRGLPRWFNEGLAMVVAGERRAERIRFSRIAQLEDTLARSKSYDNVRSAYGTAERLVRRLIDGFGRDKVLALARSVGDGADFERGFRTLTGALPAVWSAPLMRP